MKRMRNLFRRKKSCEIAKDRLKILLISDRVSCSPEMMELLLKNGKVGFRGLISKKGNKFSAYLKYVKDEEKGNYSWEFEFID